jgi:hypothetical protein
MTLLNLIRFNSIAVQLCCIYDVARALRVVRYKDKGHKHPEIFHNQNELKLFNSLVQDINLSYCPKAKNTVQFMYMSPNFTKDILGTFQEDDSRIFMSCFYLSLIF